MRGGGGRGEKGGLEIKSREEWGERKDRKKKKGMFNMLLRSNKQAVSFNMHAVSFQYIVSFNCAVSFRHAVLRKISCGEAEWGRRRGLGGEKRRWRGEEREGRGKERGEE